MINQFNVDLVVFTGVAGAISAELNIGDIVIANQLVQHDLDPRPFFKRYEIPRLNISAIKVLPELIDYSVQAAQLFVDASFIDSAIQKQFQINDPKIYVGEIASGDQFVSELENIKQLRADLPKTLCVEMEGAVVAQVCYEHSIKFAVIRTISDKADHSASIDFPIFTQ